MSAGTETLVRSTGHNVRGLSTRTGVAAFAAAAGLAAYAAYGDPHAKANQQSAVPFLIVVSAVVAAVLFGVMVPKALSSMRAGQGRPHRWALGHGAAAIVLCAAFWSGLPMVVGAAGLLLGAEGRRQTPPGRTARPYSIALTLSGLAVAASVALTVLGNTVLSHS